MSRCQRRVGGRKLLVEVAVKKGLRVVFAAESECEDDLEHEALDDDGQIVS